MVRLAHAAVAVVALAACGGGGGASSPSRAEPEPTTTTTAPEAEIDLSEPIPAGSLHGTPRPPLENTGDDYVAIFESLEANFRWLTENPDPTLVSEIYVPETEDHATQVDVFEELVANNWHAADDGYRLISVEVVSVEPDVVTLRVTDTLPYEQIVDRNGDRVGAGRGNDPAPSEKVVLLARDSTGRWKFADLASTEPAEIKL